MSIAVYEPLVKKLRQNIRRGKFTPGVMLGTEIQFAKKEGISRDSVRMAVNSLIKEGLVERRAGKGVYVRKPEAALIVELLLPSLGGIWAGVATGAQTVARDHGFKAQIFNADGDFEADLDAIRRLPLTEVDGAIVGSLHQSRLSAAVIELHQKNFPLVVVDQQMHDVDLPSVIYDGHAAGYLAGQKFVQCGHRRIGFVGFARGANLRGRLDGLRDAVNDAGVAFDRSLIVELPATTLVVEGGREAFEQSLTKLLQRPARPTALLFHNDYLAMLGYQVIKRVGLRIPQDLSVVSAGNDPLCELTEPPMTAMDLPGSEMGRVAMELLLQRINDPQSTIEHRVLPVKWIERQSVGAVKQSEIK